jgi:16S rRNA (uracil1498-N3)-methyltransferase
LARRRFIVDAIHGGAAELRGDDARHLTRVLRAEAGRQYEISDSRQAYLAEIVEAHGERVVFRVVEPVESPALPVRIVLCAALVKFDRFEWTLEKATELGVERILPVETARGEKGLLEASRKRCQRWERIARESSQQSRRVSAPEMPPAVSFRQALAVEADHRYFLEENVAPPLLRLLPASKAATDRIALLAGPEGGWTTLERETAAAAGWRSASLGPLVLRAETAAIAAVALVANAWMP